VPVKYKHAIFECTFNAAYTTFSIFGLFQVLAMEQELTERVINERKGKDMSKFLLTGLTVTAQSL